VKFERLLHKFRAQVPVFRAIRVKTMNFTPDLSAWWTCCIASVAENWNAIFR